MDIKYIIENHVNTNWKEILKSICKENKDKTLKLNEFLNKKKF